MKRIPIPTIKAFWEIEVRDKNGKLLQHYKQPCHSWVRNAYNLMFCQLAALNADDDTFGAGKLNAKDTGGTIRYGAFVYYIGYSYLFPVEFPNYGYIGPAGNDTMGILVGSGTDAESFEDYALQTKIADGTSEGELSYVEGEAPAITYTAGTKTHKADHIRYFNNNSGDTISVNELALVAHCGVGGDFNRLIAMAREKLASAVNIPDTGQLKVTYTIQLVYPA